MVTKTTRDVMDLQIRPITSGIDVDGDNGPNFTIDGTTIGGNLAGEGTFTNLTAQNITVTGSITSSGASVDPSLITDRPSETPVVADSILFSDASDSGNLKQMTLGDIGGLVLDFTTNPTINGNENWHQGNQGKIFVDDNAPTSGDGQDGDVWLEF